MEYEPKYKWQETWPGEVGLDGKPLQDFQGSDGETPIGRIRLEEAGPMKGKWQWSGHGPRKVKRHLPHQGYSMTAREAARMAEEYYDTLLANNDLRKQ
ncbi:hypothetical protein [Rhizobium grahamii]|nr:hypothetical protein [Rhizobium grahamii]